MIIYIYIFFLSNFIVRAKFTSSPYLLGSRFTFGKAIISDEIFCLEPLSYSLQEI